MRRSIPPHSVCVCVAFALVCSAFSGVAAAAAPGNDHEASAVVVGPGSYSGTLVGATNDGGSSVGDPGQPDVWYRLIAPATGTLYVDTCGTNDAGELDTTLSLQGSFNAPESELTANDDWPSGSLATYCTGVDAAPTRDSAVVLSVTFGQTVWIRVSQFDSLSAGNGAFQLHVKLSVLASDAWETARLVGLGSFSSYLSGATNDGSSSQGGWEDVWFYGSASRSGTLYVDTCGSNDAGGIDTVLSVHSNVPGMPVNELAANDDWPTGANPTACSGSDLGPALDSAVSLHVTNGQTVFIRVAVASIGDGSFRLRIGLENDSWQNATPISSNTPVFGTLAGATVDGSARAGSFSQPDVWYRYTAPSHQGIFVDTCGTNDTFGTDTVLSLHPTAGPGSSVNELAVNDDWPSGVTVRRAQCASSDTFPEIDSAVFHEMAAGETVLIRVSKSSPGGNAFVLTLPEPDLAVGVLPALPLLWALSARRRRRERTKRSLLRAPQAL